MWSSTACGYYNLGISNLASDPDGRIQTSSFQRLPVKALKTTTDDDQGPPCS
jgi:hypothetical protein